MSNVLQSVNQHKNFKEVTDNSELEASSYLGHVLSSCRMLSKFLVQFSKWLQGVKKGVIDLFLCLAMAYNVFPCTEIFRNTQTEKITDFTM